MFKQRSRRGGFTLPEVLVTVAIVAVLAAAVVPTVVNQIGKGEGASVAADVNALTHAITQFISDTRQYPGQLSHLNTQITGTQNDIISTPYSARAVSQWKGPYLATSQPLTTSFTFSGFGLVAANVLLAPSVAGNAGFITLNITSTHTHARLAVIDAAIDGGDGTFDPNCPAVATSAISTGGRFIWTETPGTPCAISAVKYRLVPTGKS